MSQFIKCDRCGKLVMESEAWTSMDATFSFQACDRQGNPIAIDESRTLAFEDRNMDLCMPCGKILSDLLKAEDHS